MNKINDKKIIVIDFDNTIVDSIEILGTIYNIYHNTNYKINSYCDWVFEDLFIDYKVKKNELDKLYTYFDSELFYYDNVLKFIDNAVEVINELSLKYNIVICSNQNVVRAERTKKLIDKYFNNNVYFARCTSFDKGTMFKSNNINNVWMTIDDKLECLDSMKDITEHLICFGNYKWNTYWNGIKFNNWNYIKEYIKTLELEGDN